MFISLSARSSAIVSRLLSRYSAGCCIAAVMAFGTNAPVSLPQTLATAKAVYTITDLGVLPSAGPQGWSRAYAINESGDVAGFSTSNTGPANRAVIFKDGKVIDLGLVPGANGSSGGNGINGDDEVTGEMDFPTDINPYGFLSHAFLYSAGRLKDLGTLPGLDSSLGTGINDSGVVTGTSADSPIFGNDLPNVFLYKAGKITAAPGFYNNLNATGNTINAAGQVAGWMVLNGMQHAAVLTNGSIALLDVPGYAEFSSQASAINDTGEVTGWLYFPDDNSHAFLSKNGKAIDIGTLPGNLISYGIGINASGQIAGASLYGGPNRPFLYTPGRGMVDVNTLLPAGSGWRLTDAAAINDKGQIAGTGFNPKGQNHAFLLSLLRAKFPTLDPELELIGTPPTTFALGGSFTVPANSTHLDPIAEVVVLQLNGYHVTIPPNRFVKTNGNFIFNGRIGKVAVGMIIRPLSGNIYLFGMEGVGAAGLPRGYPVQLTLTIGSYTGTDKVTSGYNGPAPTAAELCKYFHLDCR